MRAGVIGIGNMGSGLARNLLAAGFEVHGHDLDPDRMAAFEAMGGRPARDAAEVGERADAVFVMVMTGAQAHDVVLGSDEGGGRRGGLVSTLAPGSAVLLTATVRAGEARTIAASLEGTGIELVDSPVSGGYAGAQAGTLTLMAAAPEATLDRWRSVMEAVSGTIHRVGTEPGTGQTVKACLQSLIGSIFTATYEASVMAARAGVDGEALARVFDASSAGNAITRGSLEHILAGRFAGTGSHIATMHKDLTLSLDLARELGTPLFTAATAMQLFQAGITRHPEGDNQSVARVIEDIVDARLRAGGNGAGEGGGRAP